MKPLSITIRLDRWSWTEYISSGNNEVDIKSKRQFPLYYKWDLYNEEPSTHDDTGVNNDYNKCKRIMVRKDSKRTGIWNKINLRNAKNIIRLDDTGYLSFFTKYAETTAKYQLLMKDLGLREYTHESDGQPLNKYKVPRCFVGLITDTDQDDYLSSSIAPFTNQSAADMGLIRQTRHNIRYHVTIYTKFKLFHKIVLLNR